MHEKAAIRASRRCGFDKAALIVVRADRTPRRAASHGRELLENAKGTIIGGVLNDVPRKHGGYYGYYRYGYPNRYYGRS